jgi:Flp pilus assembly pilin Flp
MHPKQKKPVEERTPTMSREPARHGEAGQSFLEFALILILIAIVVLAIFLIMGDEIRTFVNDLLQTWFPG